MADDFYKDSVKWDIERMIYNFPRGCVKHSIVPFIVAGFALTACTALNRPSGNVPDDKLAEIQVRGTLVIATDADYMPQSKFLTSELPDPNTKCEPTQYTAAQMIGFDVEVAKEIARRLEVEPCFVTPPWSQLVAGSWGDNWDIHVGSVAMTYERMNVLYFSQPYYATPTVILVHKRNSTFKTAEDLSGKRIGVCAGCTFESYLLGTLQIPGQNIEYRIQNAQIVAYENEDPAIEDLSLGDGVRLDAVMSILPKALTAMAAGKPVKVMDEPVAFEYIGVTLDRASRRDPTRLLAEITILIQEMHRSNVLKNLSVQYQGLDLTQEAAEFDIASLAQIP
jgi:polar amino acid transport system substrate-binding protein